MAVVLREIIPDGTQWGVLGAILPHWSSLEFGQDLSSASSITFSYANDGANASRLGTGMYVVAVLDGNYRYDDSIFYIQEFTGSVIEGSESKVTTYSGTTLRGRLDKLRWLPGIGSDYMDDGMFKMVNVTPGALIRSGVENYLSRARNTYGDPVHWISGINDKPSTGWAVKIDEAIIPGTTVAESVSKYQELGLATARFKGFELTISNYADYLVGPVNDKTSTVQLKVGYNIRGGEYSESNKDLVTALLVQGATDSLRDLLEDEQAPTAVQWVLAPKDTIEKYGYHEDVLTVNDASQPGTLKAVGEVYIREHMAPRHSTNYTMVDTLHDPVTGAPLTTSRPLQDFECGDKITILTKSGATVERVYAITLTFDNPNTPTISLTLNDYFTDFEVQFDQRLRRLGV